MNDRGAAGSKEEFIETGSKFRAEGDVFLGTIPQTMQIEASSITPAPSRRESTQGKVKSL